MCLAFPMQILEIDGFTASCAARGSERWVNLLFLQEDTPVVGDFVMVQMGNAIRKISADEAAQVWALYDEILATQNAESPE